MYDISVDIINQVKDKVSAASSISVIGHSAPDADAVTSVLSLYAFFSKLYPDKKIYPVLPDDLPNYVLWLENLDKLLIGEQAQDVLVGSDVIFFVDLNEQKRVGDLEEAVASSGAFKVVIDHHPEPENFADVLISFPQAGSTTEIIFSFLKLYDQKAIDKLIATYIFTGILTDTGCFCHDSATDRTFAAVSELLRYGVEKSRIIDNIYHNYSFDRMRLMGYVLYKKMKIIPEYQFGYIVLTRQELEQFNFKFGDHENFVNLPLSVKGITVSAMFMEREDFVRVSLRSTGTVDVGQVAKTFLSGGGHKNAAGGNMDLPVDAAVERFLTEILPQIFNYAQQKN